MPPPESAISSTSRRSWLGQFGALAAAARRAQALGVLGLLHRTKSAYAQKIQGERDQELSGDTIALTIAESVFSVDGKSGKAVTINGTVPGPLIRLREGQDVTLRVTNRLKEPSSIHWHGILLPSEMDGVPGVSFAGIPPGATFTYRFPIKQSGTYWYHSHSGSQEQEGMYAPMIIEPSTPDSVQFDREYAVVLSNWSFDSGKAMIANLKKKGGYYNFQQRTATEFFADVKREGWKATMRDYMMWSQMRMDPTDFADVTSRSFSHLVNGRSPKANWTAVFRPGERIRLRFVNAASMSIYDVHIPGLKLTVVQADGQNVQPVEVDEFRIAAAETYDVIVQPTDDRAYTIFAETNDRSGCTRATLAPRAGMIAGIPARRPRPLRTMDDMGMNMQSMKMGAASGEKKMAGMDHGSMGTEKAIPADHASMPGMRPPVPKKQPAMEEMPGMAKSASSASSIPAEIPGSTPVPHGPGSHGTTNQTVAEVTRSRLHEPGTGLGGDGRRVLVYTDLRAVDRFYDNRKPERELEIHITGHMERFIWSFDGMKFSEAKAPIPFRYGERLRWTFVNDTMMEHPLHLHGMWMHLENGAGDYLPRKHTVNIKPAERVSVAITADARGNWAFHCHLLLHMEAGMFRIVGVSGPDSMVAS